LGFTGWFDIISAERWRKELARQKKASEIVIKYFRYPRLIINNAMIKGRIAMKKWSVSCDVYRKQPDKLSFLILGHYGVGPIDFLKCVIDEYKFGIFFLGHDGPRLLSFQESRRLVEGMNKEEVQACLKGKFLWLSYYDVKKLYQKEWFTLEGDAVLLKINDIEDNFECSRLPKPTGFNKDKISAKDAEYLNSILFGDDVYIFDDFQETFIVSRNIDILDIIADEIHKV
jgi:hypothetical protein